MGTILAKFKVWVTKPIFWYIVIGLVICYGYWSMASDLKAQKENRLKDVKELSDEVKKEMDSKARVMEGQYANQIETLNREIDNLKRDRAQVLAKLSTLQVKLSEIQTRKDEVIQHVYTDSELDNRFHDILQRPRIR